MSKPLTPQDMKYIQDFLEMLLYYACIVDSLLAAALSAITSHQANHTKALKQAYHQLLDYVTIHPNATI